MLKHTSLPSIEEFAAFLDGNLSANDMQQFTKLAAHDDALHQLLHANSVVDDTLDGFKDADLQLPADLMNADFEFPKYLLQTMHLHLSHLRPSLWTICLLPHVQMMTFLLIQI